MLLKREQNNRGTVENAVEFHFLVTLTNLALIYCHTPFKWLVLNCDCTWSPAKGRLSIGVCVVRKARSSPLLTDREDECGHAGHSNGSTLLQEPPDLPPRGSAGGSELLLNNSVDRGGQRRTTMVERLLHSVER